VIAVSFSQALFFVIFLIFCFGFVRPLSLVSVLSNSSRRPPPPPSTSTRSTTSAPWSLNTVRTATAGRTSPRKWTAGWRNTFRRARNGGEFCLCRCESHPRILCFVESIYCLHSALNFSFFVFVPTFAERILRAQNTLVSCLLILDSTRHTILFVFLRFFSFLRTGALDQFVGSAFASRCVGARGGFATDRGVSRVCARRRHVAHGRAVCARV
jgi:hypothetical protein